MPPRVLSRKIFEKYFTLEGDQAKCRLCSHKLKSDRIFNLKTHIVKVHRIGEDELKQKIEETYGDTLNNAISEREVRKRIVKIEICKKQFFRSYIGLVIDDSIPFNILDSKNLKNIVDPICDGLGTKLGKQFCLDGEKCKQVLELVAHNIRNEIKSDLNQRLFSLKIDSVEQFSLNVLGISVQFIKRGEIQSRILGMVELRDVGASSSQSLATEILNTLTKYDVNLSQIVSIASDNCLMKATKFLSQCSIFDVTNKGAQDFKDDNTVYLENIKMFEDNSEINLADIKISRYAAHIAQLCALDLIKESEIKNFILCCRNLVKFIKKPSNGCRETFELESLTVPQLDWPTKWGSTYSMIKSLRNAKYILDNIRPIKNESFDENFEISDCFWNKIEAYYIALSPLQQSIIKFQEKQLHYGNFYAEWLKCKLCTEKLLGNSGDTFFHKIVKSIFNSMANRTEKILCDKNLVSCLYLDPRFNHTLTLTQKRDAITHLQTLYERMQNVNIHIEQIKKEPLDTAPQLESVKFSQKEDEYLNEYLTRNFVPTSREKAEVFAKIENLKVPFLRADSNVLQFWKDKQCSEREIHALSNICFAVPTNQLIEPAFSSLKLILADDHKYMDPHTVENILLVKLNSIYLDQAIDDLPLFENEV